MISLNCPAKINLGLSVMGMRRDGYHELSGIMLAVPWNDRLDVESDPLLPAGQIRLEVINEPGIDIGPIPEGDDNIVSRTARLCLACYETGVNPFACGLCIRLYKSIPAGTGLGGASSDAAGTIRAIDNLARSAGHPGMSLESMRRIAASVGSDSVFFIRPIPSRIVGRGEDFIPVPLVGRFAAVIAVPVQRLNTGAVFGRWDALRKHSNSGKDGLTGRVIGDISPCLLVRVPPAPDDPCASKFFENDLSEAVFDLCPRSAKLLELFGDSGAFAASVTGSGSAVYGLFADIGLAECFVRTMTRNLLPGEIVRAFQIGSDF